MFVVSRHIVMKTSSELPAGPLLTRFVVPEAKAEAEADLMARQPWWT